MDVILGHSLVPLWAVFQRLSLSFLNDSKLKSYSPLFKTA